ncbi:DUF1579 domain-containing protein [Altererythrobacter xixiisoli]|uniref:DUF1579 domain-containing protein n=1 Tax=Croceibacterium xixiisoli TaxID=1476466 RepID=A0A6I4TUI4_9SPHN|nr:DUF1579 family protein [Croceibacterium xixiisoli]MXO99594.1 DUF1579 domain-containing protein [Croceibacterium xixiisoli]
MADWLEHLVGEWTCDADSIPSDPQGQTTGTETVERRGKWVVIESDDHARFQLVFNPQTGRVLGDFLNWHHPGLWIYDGAPDGDRLVLDNRGPRMDGGEGETDYQDIWTISSADERTTIGRFRDDSGEWRDFNVTRYRRKV